MTATTHVTRPAIPKISGYRALLGFARDPINTLERGWQAHGDFFRLQLGPRALYVVSSPELAHEILGDGWRRFPKPAMFDGGTILTPLLGHSVLTIDGESWFARRKLLQPVFHRQHIAAMAQAMVDAGTRMLTRWRALPAHMPVDLATEMKRVTQDIINRTMFSVDISSNTDAADSIGAAVDLGLHGLTSGVRSPIRVPAWFPGSPQRRVRAARRTLDMFIYDIIRRRRATSEARHDLLDLLLGARDADTGEGMSDEAIRNEVATVYGAGYETTSLALTWAWLLLNQHPQVLSRLRAELATVLGGRAPTLSDLPKLPYTLAVLEESLRLYPPIAITTRRTTEIAQLHGVEVPPDAILLLAIVNLHRHPDIWQRPHAFEPERFLPENRGRIDKRGYLPFLAGPHLCIGRDFALMEGQLLLAMMAGHCDVRIDTKEPVARELAITLRPRRPLMATLTFNGETNNR
jgi:cytochrome P450